MKPGPKDRWRDEVLEVQFKLGKEVHMRTTSCIYVEHLRKVYGSVTAVDDQVERDEHAEPVDLVRLDATNGLFAPHRQGVLQYKTLVLFVEIKLVSSPSGYIPR